MEVTINKELLKTKATALFDIVDTLKRAAIKSPYHMSPTLRGINGDIAQGLCIEFGYNREAGVYKWIDANEDMTGVEWSNISPTDEFVKLASPEVKAACTHVLEALAADPVLLAIYMEGDYEEYRDYITFTFSEVDVEMGQYSDGYDIEFEMRLRRDGKVSQTKPTRIRRSHLVANNID